MSIVLFFCIRQKKKSKNTFFSRSFFFVFLFKGAFALLAFISHHIKWFPKRLVSIT